MAEPTNCPEGSKSLVTVEGTLKFKSVEYATLAVAQGKFWVVSGQTPKVESWKLTPGVQD